MNKQKLTVGIAVVVALVIAGYFFIGSNANLSMSDQNQNSASNSGATTGLVVQDTTVGTGATAQNGDTVTVNYTGKLDNGTVFDTSIGRAPFSFVLGAGQVIPGWDLGLQGMKVGGKRTLIIPPNMAYGSQTVGPIPANSTLTFEVELLSVTPAATSTQTAPQGPAAQ